MDNANPNYDSRGNCNAIIETSTNTLIAGCKNTRIPNSVTRIESSAFDGIKTLRTIDIPNSIISIGDNAFHGTAWYNNQPNGVVYAGKVVYNYKGTMPPGTSITLEEGTLGIGDYAFKGFTDLSSIEIPNSVTNIGDNAFNDCTGLTSIKFPNSVISIGASAFDGCTDLTNIEIPNSVISVGFNAFRGTSWYNNQPNGVVYAGKVAYKYKGVMPQGTSIKLKEGTLSISEKAFYNCTRLISIEIPNSVTDIGDTAFGTCSGLTSIEIPNSVTKIGYAVFDGCISLTSLKIGSSVTSIGVAAFSGCNHLKSVEIGNSVTSIGNSAFSGCSALTEIHWKPNAETDLSSRLRDASLISYKRTLYLYKNAQNSEMVNILFFTFDGEYKEIIVVEDYDSYDLTVTNAGMSTLYLNYPVAVPDDVNMLGVFYVYEIDGNIMLLKRLKDYIPANNGVIIMANAGTFTFNGTGDEVDEITDNQLQGVTESTPVSSIDGTVYTLGRGVNSGYFGFHKYTGANIPANKAFLVRSASSGVNSFNLVLDNEDGTSTAIGRIENGEFVPESNVIYDLQGRRVENPSKGIYIVNGKKQYIK